MNKMSKYNEKTMKELEKIKKDIPHLNSTELVVIMCSLQSLAADVSMDFDLFGFDVKEYGNNLEVLREKIKKYYEEED